jgi:hypothetical protein
MVLFGAGLAMSNIDWLASGAFALVCALLAFMLAALMRPMVLGADPPLVAASTVGLLMFCGLVALVIVLDTSGDDDPVTPSDWILAVGAMLLMLLMLLVAAWASWRMLLRVFKPSERSEAFIDRFLARWRFAGPVWMIAGPDLAGAFMEPTNFSLTWVIACTSASSPIRPSCPADWLPSTTRTTPMVASRSVNFSAPTSLGNRRCFL